MSASIALTSAGGIMVSIAAFQAVDPGSIPGQRIYLFIVIFNLVGVFKTHLGPLFDHGSGIHECVWA